MLIKIGRFDITECWDGVFYKKPSEYPDINDWEIQNILDFSDTRKIKVGSAVLTPKKEVRSRIEKVL